MARKFNVEQAVEMTVGKISDDILSLSNQRDNAVSTFRRTAENLAKVNERLNERITSLNSLAEFVQEQKDSAQRMVADNDAVKDRILEIIGE